MCLCSGHLLRINRGLYRLKRPHRSSQSCSKITFGGAAKKLIDLTGIGVIPSNITRPRLRACRAALQELKGANDIHIEVMSRILYRGRHRPTQSPVGSHEPVHRPGYSLSKSLNHAN